jgi:hypothetical protein
VRGPEFDSHTPQERPLEFHLFFHPRTGFSPGYVYPGLKAGTFSPGSGIGTRGPLGPGLKAERAAVAISINYVVM